MKIAVLVGIMLFLTLGVQTPSLLAQETSDPTPEAEDGAAVESRTQKDPDIANGWSDPLPDDEPLAESEELAMTQEELRGKHRTLMGIQLGPGYPWQDLGAGLQWQAKNQWMWSLGVGVGYYDLSVSKDGQNFLIDSSINTIWLGYKRYLGKFPLAFEAFGGLSQWNGNLFPRGSDQDNDEEASSLVSDLSHMSLGAGAKLSLVWHWENGIFLEYTIVQANLGKIISERYTNNTATARDMVRQQIEDLQIWAGFNLKVGYWIR